MDGVSKRNTLYSTLVKNQTQDANLDFQMEKVKSKFDGYLAEKMAAGKAMENLKGKKKFGPNALKKIEGPQAKRSS